jgi:hypothetical protein
MATYHACIECGDDDPAEGFKVCTDCLIRWGDPDDPDDHGTEGAPAGPSSTRVREGEPAAQHGGQADT